MFGNLFGRKKTPAAAAENPPAPADRKRAFYGGHGSNVYIAPLKDLHREVFQTGGLSLLSGVVLGRIRQFALTNPYIESYLRNMLDGVIGARAITPNFSTVENQAKQKQLKNAWRIFGQDVALYNRMTMRELQRAVLKSYLIDGRTFLIIKHFSKPKKDFPAGFKLVHLEKEMLDTSANDTEKGIINGIEYDANGVITKYHFYDFTTAENIRTRKSTADGLLYGVATTSSNKKIIDANMVIDICDNGSISQVYNYPSKLLSVLRNCLKLESLDSYLLDSMEMQARIGGFVKTSIDTPQPTSKDVKKLDSGDVPDKVGDVNELIMLAAGMEYQDFNRSMPNTDIVAMRKEILRSTAAALGVDYAALNSDGKESNYSSMRAFSLLTRQTFFTAQMLIEELMMMPIVAQFLQLGPVRLSNTMIQSASATTYDKRIYHAVDPMKDATAQALQIQMALRSANSIAREYGADVKSNIEELAQIFDQVGADKIYRAGMVKSLMSSGAAAAPPSDDEEAAHNAAQEAKEEEDEKTK